MPKNSISIPDTFSSIDEIQTFWDQHSTVDFNGEMEEVRFVISPDLKSKIENKKHYKLLDFMPEQIAEIESQALSENLDSKEIIRKWVLEHV